MDENINRSAPIFLFDAFEKTDLVNHIKTSVKKLLVRFRSFDPQEQARLAVHEAIAQVAESEGVIVSIVPSRYSGSEVHNYRAAFIAGLAHGMSKCLSIIQIGDAPTPLDYRDLTDPCYNKEQIERAVERFTLQVSPALQRSVQETTSRSRTLLETLDLGGSVAENEMQSIDDYYLDTAAFLRASRGEVRLVIGRKGSGKSALFLHLRNEKRKQKANIVVDLKPEGYKLLKFKELIVDVLSEGTLNHVVSAIWEYVLLLEIAYKLLEKDKGVHSRDRKLAERYDALSEVYQQDEYYSEGDFSERVSLLLDEIGRKLREQGGSATKSILSDAQISELIYKHPVRDLRDRVSDYLKEKSETWILVDNLDKGWPSSGGLTKGDVGLILCLFEALDKIERSFRRKGYERFYSTVFLRADIYDNLINQTSDKGKVIPVSVDWSDKDALKELLRMRFVHSGFSRDISVAHAWEMVAEVGGQGGSSLEYLIDQSLFRPRALLDLISLCRSIAINRRHTKISELDIGEAVRRASLQMIDNVNLELRDVNPDYDQLVYSFLGLEPDLNRAEVSRIIKSFASRRRLDLKEDEVIDLLLWFGFFGLRSSSDRATFIFDLDYNMNMLRALSDNSRLTTHYVIHPSFRPSLSISDPLKQPRIRTLL